MTLTVGCRSSVAGRRSPLKIAIVVHGRFHAFDLSRALIQRGHEVTLFTNYPRWAVERFGIARERVCSFWPHGVISRSTWWLRQKASVPYPEAWLHRLFGQWAARELIKEPWDVVHCWSGVSEEILRTLEGRRTLTLMMRGSAHIRTQAQILQEEEQRIQTPLDRPSPWIIAREEREYALADRIVVLSSFAYESFVSEGVPSDKLCLLPLGTSLAAFRPAPYVVEARCQRILSDEPLRVLYVGALSFQKGMWDMEVVLHSLGRDRFRFRFVGPMTSEVSGLVAKVHHLVEFVPKQPQRGLPDWYAWGDLFVFPTIQDGFAQVLAQAYASALPILTTTNCSGPDLIREDQTGWVLPIRSPEAFIERLRWCAAHRKELVAMVQRIYNEFQPRDWADVAADFEKLCVESMQTGP
jgi:glycosyltransferase involved in cell wall biosynthesis